MGEKLGNCMRKREENKSTTTLYMKRGKSPLEPSVARTSIRGERQYFCPDRDRVWRRSVQVSVTEIVGVLVAEGFMPMNEHVQRVMGDDAEGGTTHFSWMWPGTIAIERCLPQIAQR